MSEPIKKPNHTPESYSPVKPEIMSMVEVLQNYMRAEESKTPMTLQVVEMKPFTFVGKTYENWLENGISGFWDEAHGSGFAGNLYSLQDNFRDFGLFFKDGRYMIGIEEPQKDYSQYNLDKSDIPISKWVIAYGKFQEPGVSTHEGWSFIDDYIKSNEIQINEDIPVIEKYPDGAEPLDQTYLLMKAIF